MKETEKTKGTEAKDAQFEMFREAHALYGGMKRFVTTEFKELKKHDDWKEVLPMLKGAIENQVKWREARTKSGDFLPEWKHMKKYLEGRHFEETYPVAPDVHYNVKTDKTPYF